MGLSLVNFEWPTLNPHRGVFANSPNIPRYWEEQNDMAPLSNNNNNNNNSNNDHSELPTEEAQLLQDIARDGAADEYGYDSAQANGGSSSIHFTFRF